MEVHMTSYHGEARVCNASQFTYYNKLSPDTLAQCWKPLGLK